MQRDNDFLYLELASAIRSQIQAGLLKQDHYLMSENDLAIKYGMSRTSVRKALQVLLEERLIVKRHGKGTVVADGAADKTNDGNTLRILCPYYSNFSRNGLTDLIEQFRSACPGVEVKVIRTLASGEEAYPELHELGVRPDLIMITDRFFDTARAIEAIPIFPLVAGKMEIAEPLANLFRRDGALVAAPLTFSPIFLTYRRDHFRDCGLPDPAGDWSLAQFAATAERLTRDTDGDGYADVYGTALSSAITRWLFIAMKMGVRFPLGDRFDELLPVLEFMRKLMLQDRSAPLAVVHHPHVCLQMFEEGNLSMLLTSVLAFDRGKKAFEYGIATFPHGHEAGSLLIAAGLLIPKFAPNAALAKLFVSFAMDPDTQRRMSERTKYLSIYPAINRELWSPGQIGAMGLDERTLKRSLFSRQLFENPALIDELPDAMTKFWAGVERPADTIRKLNQLARQFSADVSP